ncbi:copia protein [Tanacetum coccineum]
MEAYFQKIESLVTILQSLDCIMNDEDVVHYALEGIPEKYNQVCGYMHYQNTFPDLKTARSLLITEEMRLKTKEVALPADSSSQMVLMAQTGTNRRPSNPQVKSWRPCFNFAKGSCRFGSECCYAHDPNAKPRDIEEGIDYDEVFAPVARMEAIMLFLAYASFMGFIVYQMDVKSAFLYGTIEEEVYLKGQPKLGLWYPKDSPFDLDAFSDSDYVVASHDRKSKTGDLKFVDQHNMVACLEKSEGNADFHEIVDFLTASSVHYALTTIVISESSVRRDLHFNDEDGITCLTNDAIFENLALMGYESDSNKLTFQKALFSPQWKYLIHTILHCLSSKSTSWNEFSTNIASAVICLANGQKFNFSKLIFDGMLRNLDTNTKKFLMYPRFLQLFLNNQITLAEPFNDVYQTPAHTKKVFTNMKRKGKDFLGRVTPLFASMLAPPVVEGEGSGQPSEPQPAPSTAQPRIEEQIPVTESSSPQNTQSPRQALQEDTQLPQTSVHISNVADEVVFKEWDDRVVRATTTAASLDAAQASGGVIAQTRSERESKHSYDLPLLRGNTPGSDEERIEQDDLTDFVPPTPHDSPLSGGHTPGSDEDCSRFGDQKAEKEGLKIRKEAKGKNSRDETLQDCDFDELDVDNAMENVEGDAETLGRNTAEQITIAGDTVNTASIDVSVAGPSNVSTIDPSTSTAGDIFEDKMMTIADTLVAIRSTRPRTTSVIIHDVEEEPRRSTPAPTAQPSSKDKGKALMVEPEKPLKNLRKAQIQMDEELAIRLHEEEKAKLEKIQRERVVQEEASNAALIAEFDNNKSFEEIQKLYKKEQKWIKDFIPIDSEKGRKKAASSSGEEQLAEKEKELSEEELQKLLVVVPVEEVYVEALQKFDRDDLVKLWDFVKKRFNITEPTDDKEKELWVEPKRLFEPDNDDILWKLQRYMNDPLVWRLYDTCGVQHVSLVRGHDIFMLVEK